MTPVARYDDRKSSVLGASLIRTTIIVSSTGSSCAVLDGFGPVLRIACSSLRTGPISSSSLVLLPAACAGSLAISFLRRWPTHSGAVFDGTRHLAPVLGRSVTGHRVAGDCVRNDRKLSWPVPSTFARVQLRTGLVSELHSWTAPYLFYQEGFGSYWQGELRNGFVRRDENSPGEPEVSEAFDTITESPLVQSGGVMLGPLGDRRKLDGGLLYKTTRKTGRSQDTPRLVLCTKWLVVSTARQRVSMDADPYEVPALKRSGQGGNGKLP
ncbi:hypothetical protein C8R47DRAFT_1076724 [Mycena vitilis]|nr:hypothetical protein C8R47DRAFT_1076724 [Mycena vitilis]